MCRQEIEVDFLLGTFMELMDIDAVGILGTFIDIDAVGKQKELLLGTVKGVLGAKLRHLPSRSVLEVHLPRNWFLQGQSRAVSRQ